MGYNAKFSFSVFYNMAISPYVNENQDVTMSEIFGKRIDSSTASNLRNGKRVSSKKYKELVDILNSLEDEEIARRLERCIDKETAEQINIGIIAEVFEAFEGKSKSKEYCFDIINSTEATIYMKLAVLLKYSFITYPLADGTCEYTEDIKQNIEEVKRSYNILEKYQGEYFVYYRSYHYSDEIHCGKIHIFRDEKGEHRVNMIIGISKAEYLDDSYKGNLLTKAIRASNPEDADRHLQEYLKPFNYHYNKRVYLLTGKAALTAQCIQISFERYKREGHIQVMYLNVSRAHFSGSERSYKGGLGLMVALPNNSTRKIRSYLIGVTETKVPEDYYPRLGELLKLKPTTKERIEIQADSDNEFWNLILQSEYYYGEKQNNVYNFTSTNIEED